MNKEQAQERISELVQRFEDQYESYRKIEYNETLTRRDFIDPFFKALGWDIDNSQGFAEAYREVVHEDKIKIAGVTKAPDYSFKLPGGKRLFFLEAKKPAILVKEDIQPAYQVRSYAYSSGMPISIITDFEEFAVYDCTKKPLVSDKASVGRIRYLTFKDYKKEFDFIWETFSKERVLKGGFDKFIQSDTAKKGTATVDKDFLQSLDEWRSLLATSISKNNLQLNEDELNYVLQQTLDRIIFLRIAEDRGVEPYGNLKNTLKHGTFYNNVFELFCQADEKYNSGLFDFKKDKISKAAVIDNKTVKSIIEGLYFPISPFRFAVMPVEIMGTAYERFLGKQITLDKNHKAHIDEKPEVRKAGGVYYTPQFIVEYIVANTVGKLIKGKKPKDIAKLKIVDPACGSGSFLIGAYQCLLDYHKNYYTENGKNIKGAGKPLTPDGNLTTAEKKRILLNNIFGVDIDVNAVEVTKLSLLLKCMEGETEASISMQLRLFNDRVLPTLDENIKSGNSLVDTDFYESVLDFGDDKKVKPFNWKKAFPEVFNQGSFDVVIGNPPYGALFSEDELKYFKAKYTTSIWRGESYLLFVERALKLLKNTGLLGYIIPDTLLNLGFTQSLREYILQNSKLQEIVSLPSNVFAEATVDTILLLTEKADKKPNFHLSNVSVKTFGKREAISSVKNPRTQFFVKTKEWYDHKSFNLQANSDEKSIIRNLVKGKRKIDDVAEMYSGVKTYEVGKGNPPQTVRIRDTKPFTSDIKKGDQWEPFYDGKHIGRYELLWNNNNWINYGKWLAAPRDPENFVGDKILIRKITGRTLIATYIPTTSYCNTLLFVLKIKDISYSYKAMLAILNSRLIGWYFRKHFQISDDDTFPQIMIRDILQFPIPEISTTEDNVLTEYVDQLLKFHKEIKSVKLQSKKEQLLNKIDYCESKIDELVYKIYGVENEEKKAIESEFLK